MQVLNDCSWFPHAGPLSVIDCSWFPYAGSLSLIDCSWFPHAGPLSVIGCSWFPHASSLSLIGCSWFPHAGSLSLISCSWFPHAGSLSLIGCSLFPYGGSLSLIGCSWFPHAGPKPVDVKIHPMPWIATHHPHVQVGGTWRPDCQPRQKVAILVPYRDRHEDLLLLLNNIHPFMQAQLLEYTVYLVEQVMSP